MAGEPSRAATKDFGAKMEAARTRPYMWPVMVEGRDWEQTKDLNSNRYPTRLIPKTDYDTDWAMKQELTAANMITSARPMPFTEKDLEFLKEKRDAEEYAGFQTWFESRYDLNNPAIQALFRDLMPSYFESRKQLITEQINNSHKYALLRLNGAQSEDDLILQYMVETGRVKLPKGPIHEPFEWAEAEVERYRPAGQGGRRFKFFTALKEFNQRSYERGLLNPFGIRTAEQGAYAANIDNMSDIKGNPEYQISTPYGVVAPLTPSYANYAGPDLGYPARSATFAANYTANANNIESRYYSENVRGMRPSVGLPYGGGRNHSQFI